MSWWKAEELWPGERVFIIGGGFSLQLDAGIPAEEIRSEVIYPAISEYLRPMIGHEKVIGINNAYKLGDWVDICWFCDKQWYMKHKINLNRFAGMKIHCCNKSGNAEGTHELYRGKAYGIDTNKTHVAWNGHSGASAINLAYHLGARQIILIGFDMKFGDNRRNNFHTEHAQYPVNWNPYDRFFKAYPLIKRDARLLGLSILDATTDGALTQFPKVNLSAITKRELVNV